MKKTFCVALLLLVSLWLTAQNADDYREAANRGDAEAQYNLGLCYYNGDGVTQYLEQAVYWVTKAANQDYAKAQVDLGIYYSNIQDFEQAVSWFNKAANQGHTKAQALLVELGRL